MKIVYASTSGNVEAVVEKVSEILTAHGIHHSLHRAEQTRIQDIKSEKLLIFATSTWEHGEINPFFDRLLAEMKEVNFKDKSAAFIGLGDMRYEPVYFCQGIKILNELFLKNGGTEIGQTMFINGEPYGLLDTTVQYWAEDFVKLIKK